MKFEFLNEDVSGGKIWKVQAATVSTSRNGRKYTKDELSEDAFSLSYRPLDYNHDSSTMLPYPANQTLEMSFDPLNSAVVGKIRVVDPETNRKIESGIINNVSVTQVSNETCANSDCSQKIQYGMAYTRLALLENALPGDPNARIIKTESFADILENNFIDNSQLVSITSLCFFFLFSILWMVQISILASIKQRTSSSYILAN